MQNTQASRPGQQAGDWSVKQVLIRPPNAEPGSGPAGVWTRLTEGQCLWGMPSHNLSRGSKHTHMRKGGKDGGQVGGLDAGVGGVWGQVFITLGLPSHILITGAQTTTFAQVCEVLFSFPHVLVNLVQAFFDVLQLL